MSKIGQVACVGILVAGLFWLLSDGARPSHTELAPPEQDQSALEPSTQLARLESEAPAEGARLSAEHLVLPRAKQTEARALASEKLTFKGRVVSVERSPIPGATVHFWAQCPPIPETMRDWSPSVEPWVESFAPWWRSGVALKELEPPKRVLLDASNLEATRRASSALDGSFVFEVSLPAGGTEDYGTLPIVLVIAPGFAASVHRIFGPRRETGELGEIVLGTGVEVKGRVLDEQGRPLASASIALGSHYPLPFSFATKSDAEGNFRLRNVGFKTAKPYGSFSKSWVDSPEFLLPTWEDSLNFEVHVELENYAPYLEAVREFKTDTKLGELQLFSALAIEGRILDPAGNPLQGAHVVVTDNPIESYSRHHDDYEFEAADDSILMELEVANLPSSGQALSDAEGDFRIEGRRFFQHVLYARHPDFEPARLRNVLPGKVPLRLQLPTRREGRVQVLGPKGVPIAGVELNAWRLLNEWSGRPLEVRPAGTTASDFLLLGMGPGQTRLRIIAPECSSMELTLASEELSRAGGKTIQLKSGAVLHGIVIDPIGKPVPYGTVVAELQGHDPRPQFEADVDREGSWGFDGLELGSYKVMLNNTFFLPSPDKTGLRDAILVELDSSSPEVWCELISKRGTEFLALASLKGRVLSPGGYPAANYVQLCRSGVPLGQGESRASPKVGDDFTYSIGAIPAGEWDVHLDGLLMTSVTLAEGEARELDLHAQDQARIAGSVRIHGQPVAGAKLFARLEAPGVRPLQSKSSSDEAGRFVLPLPHGGTWNIMAVAPHQLFPSSWGLLPSDEAWKSPGQVIRRVSVAEHASASVLFELHGGHVQSRLVGGAAREPIAKHLVRLHAESGLAVAGMRTDSEGKLSFQGMLPGNYRLVAERRNGWSAASSAWFFVGDGEAITQVPDFQLMRGVRLHGATFSATGVPAPHPTRVRLWSVELDEVVELQDTRKGRFDFQGLAPGMYRLALFDKDSFYVEKEGQLGQEVLILGADVELDLVSALIFRDEE